jgi:hypothetical protein
MEVLSRAHAAHRQVVLAKDWTTTEPASQSARQQQGKPAAKAQFQLQVREESAASDANDKGERCCHRYTPAAATRSVRNLSAKD